VTPQPPDRAGSVPAPAVSRQRPAVRDARSVPDRVARQLLRLEDVAPRALMPVKGSLFISAARCVLTYAIIPAAVPVLGISGVMARPLSIVLSALAAILAIVSLRRVWMADWNHRWAYTAFTATVVALLVSVVLIDVRALTT
jgi:hypothetical protein